MSVFFRALGEYARLEGVEDRTWGRVAEALGII